MRIEIAFGDREERSIDIFTAIMAENGFECVVISHGSDAFQPVRVFTSKENTGDGYQDWMHLNERKRLEYPGGFLTLEQISRLSTNDPGTPCPPCYSDMYHGEAFPSSYRNREDLSKAIFALGFTDTFTYRR